MTYGKCLLLTAALALGACSESTGGSQSDLCGNDVCEPGEESSCAADCLCGNGRVDTGEDCDGDVGAATCEAVGYGAGELACAADCTFDVTGCGEAYCGNGKIDEGESCDGDDLGDGTCEAIGFSGGQLACTDECRYEVAGCCNDFCPGVGETVCVGDNLQACVMTETGCLIWESTDCTAADEVCDDSGDAPMCVCVDRCPMEGVTICSQDDAVTCELQASGCRDWSVTTDCSGAGQSCAVGPDGPVCVPAASGEDCSDPFPVSDGANLVAWSALNQDYLTTLPSCASSTLTGPDIVLAYDATVDGYIRFEMEKPSSTRYALVVSDAACGTPSPELACVSEYSGELMDGEVPVTAGTTYYFYISDLSSGTQPLINPFALDITAIDCAGIAAAATDLVPADGTTTSTLSPTLSVDFDRRLATGTGVITIMGDKGTSLSYDLATSPTQVTFSSDDTTMTIDPGQSFAPGEKLAVSWTGLADALCGQPVAPPTWEFAVIEPSCAPGFGGMAGNTAQRFTTTLPAGLSEYYLAADEDPDGYVYVGGTTDLYRMPKAGGAIEDVEALAGLTSSHLGYAMTIVGQQIFTIESITTGTSGRLWRISSDGGATWQIEDYATFPTAPGDDFRAAAVHGGRIYLATDESSTAEQTEIWSVDAEGAAVPVMAKLELSIPDERNCNGLAMDDHFYYLLCGNGDRFVRADRNTGVVTLITDAFDLSTISGSAYAHDIDGNGAADVVYFHGWEELIFYACDPGGTPFADVFADYGGTTGAYGMGYDRAGNVLWAFDDDTEELVSFQ